MVNLLPEDFRRQEEREHNETLAEKKQEDVVMYTQAKMMKKEQAHKGEVPVETSRGGVSGRDGVSARGGSPAGGNPVSTTERALPSFVKKGGIKKESLFHIFRKKIHTVFGKRHDITPTVHAQPKPQQQALKDIDLGEKVKEDDKKQKTKNKKSLFPRMQVNLISEDVLMERSEHVAFVRLGMVALASVCMVGIVWFFLQMAVTQKQVRIDQLVFAKDIVAKEVDRITRQTTAARKIQTRITAAQALADEHISWQKLLSFFEENTLAVVSFDGIALDKNDPYGYSLQATAPSVEDMLAQWRIFEDSPHIESATISGYSREDDTTTIAVLPPTEGNENEEENQQLLSQPSQQGSVSFTIDIVMKPSVFD